MSSRTPKLVPTLLSVAIFVALSGTAVAHGAHAPEDSSSAGVAVAPAGPSVVPQVANGASQQGHTNRAKKQKKVQNLSAVVVTGSRTGAHTVKDSLQPITVVSPESLHKTGFHRLSKALDRRVPSMNYTTPAGGDIEGYNRAYTLRSLPASDTLVLINGKRWHKSALIGTLGNYGQGQQFVDMNSIPISAVGHVEVLRNGASAQYGSDAIAGVINIILKKGAEDNSLTGSTGLYSAGDGFEYHTAGSFGFSLGENSWLRVSVQHTNQNRTNRAGPDRRVPQLGPKFQFGLNPFHASNIMLNGQIQVQPGMQFYMIGDYGHKEGKPAEFYRYGYNTPFPKSPYMRTIYPDGFLPHQHMITRNRALILGLRGKNNGWHWDTSVNLGGDQNWDHTVNTMNFAFFHDTGSTQTAFYDGALQARQQAFSVNLNKSFDVSWLPNPLGVAFGGLWLRESYRVEPGELGSYYTGTSGISGGAQGFAGWSPQDAVSASRHNRAVYLQMESKLTDKFKLSVAGRHSHYPDFGNNFSYAVSGRFAATPTFALRGTVSSGFRAPSVGQEVYTSISSHFEGVGNSLGLPQGIYLEGLIGVNRPLAQALGATPLKAVTSHNYSAGFVWTPTKDFTTTLDFYRVVLKNRIAISSVISLSTPSIRSFLSAHGFPNTHFAGIRYFTNAGKVRSQGVDLVLNYVKNVGNGELFSTVTGDYHKNKVMSIRPNPPVLDSLGVLFKRLGRSAILGLVGGGSAPKGKIIFSERYDTGHWEFGGFLTRYGSYTSYNSTEPKLDQTFGAEWVLDLNMTYYSGPWSFTAGSSNIGNNYPDRVRHGQDVHGAFPYSQLAPFGFNGAFYFVRASYSW